MKTDTRLVSYLMSIAGLYIGFGFLSSAALGEDWKGVPSASQWDLGALTGAAVIDSSAGFVVLGTASKKIVSHGFVPDINDSVSFEAQFGPVFVSGGPAWFYSAHLRWNFEKDDIFSLYALGGVGGNILSTTSLSRIEFFPRFGVGGVWKVDERVQLRGELSHELMAVGVVFPI